MKNGGKGPKIIVPLIASVKAKADLEKETITDNQELGCIQEEICRHFHWDRSKALTPKEENFHILLYGAPGSGKTTTISLIKEGLEAHQQHPDKKFDKVIYLDFNLLNDNHWEQEYLGVINKKFFECFVHHCSEKSEDKRTVTAKEIASIDRLLLTNVLFIADGYSEEFDKHNKLLSKIYEYKNVIVSTRTLTDSIKTHDFKLHIKQLGFNENKIRAYISNNVGLDSKITDIVFKNNEMKTIAKNPQYLETLCKFWRKYEEIMDNNQNFRLTSTIVYEDIVYSIFVKYLADVEEKNDRYSLSIASIESHPLMLMLQENAFDDAFEVTHQNSVEKFKDAIMSKIPPESSIRAISQVIEKLGIVDYKTHARVGSTFVFYNNGIKAFLAASHLRSMLTSGNVELIEKAKDIISINAIKPSSILVLKFLSGLIVKIKDSAQRDEAKAIFWDCIVKNSDDIVKIHGDYTIKLLMHLLSQTITNSLTLLPSAQEEIVNEVNKQIKENINKWYKVIIESQYSSKEIVNFLRDHHAEHKLISLQVVPALDFDNSGMIRVLSDELQVSNDLEIIDACMRGLKFFSSNPKVLDNLMHQAASSNKFTKLMAINVLGDIGSDSYINFLLQELRTGELSSVLEVLDALKNYKNSHYYDQIIEDIINKMSVRGAHKNILTDKCLETLQALGMTLEMLEKKLLDLYDPYKDETYTYMNVLANIYDQRLESGEYDVQQKIYGLWQNNFRITWGRDVNCRGRIVELLSFKYDNLNSKIRDDYVHWLSKRFSLLGGVNPGVKKSVIDSIGNIFPHLEDAQKNIMFDVLMSRKSVESRIIVVGNYYKIIGYLTPEQREVLKERVIKQIEGKEEIALRNKVFFELKAIKEQLDVSHPGIVFFEDIIQHFISASGKIKERDADNIEVLGKLANYASSDLLKSILDIILKQLMANESIAIKKESILALENLIQVLIKNNIEIEQDKIQAIYSSMIETIEYTDRLISSNEVAPKNARRNLDNEIYQKNIAYKVLGSLVQLSLDDSFNDSISVFLLNKLCSDKETLDTKKYIIDGIISSVSKFDSNKIEQILDYLMEQEDSGDLYLASVNLIQNALMHKKNDPMQDEKIISFLSKAVFGEEIQKAQKWALVGYIDKLSKESQNELLIFLVDRYIEGDAYVVSSHEKNFVFKASLILLSLIAEINNPTMHRLVANFFLKSQVSFEVIESFIGQVLLRHNDIEKIDTLSNLKSIFLYDARLVERLDKLLEDVKKFSPALTEREDLKMLIEEIQTPKYDEGRHLDISITDGGEIFIDGRRQTLKLEARAITGIFRDLERKAVLSSSGNKLKIFSIIDSKKLTEDMAKVSFLKAVDEPAIIIVEELTAFGKLRITKIQNNFETSEEYEKNNIPLQEIFGAPSSSKEYKFLSVDVPLSKSQEQIDKFKGEDFDSFVKMKMVRTILHNDLIRITGKILSSLDTIEKKIDKVSFSIEDHFASITEALKGLDLKTTQINNFIRNLNFLNLISSPREIEEFSSYQKSLYITIVKQLVANYLMALTLTYKSDTLLSRAGTLFDIIGDYVPIAGPGLKFLGIITNTIDQVNLDKLINNIKSFAVTPSEMEAMAKQIARIFMNNKVNYDAFKDFNQISDLLKNAIDSLSVEAIINQITALCIDAASSTSEDDQIKLGEEHGMLIVNNILMPYISTTEVNIVNTAQQNVALVSGYVFSKNFVERLPVEGGAISSLVISDKVEVVSKIAITPEGLIDPDLPSPPPAMIKSKSHDFLSDDYKTPFEGIVDEDIMRMPKDFSSLNIVFKVRSSSDDYNRVSANMINAVAGSHSPRAETLSLTLDDISAENSKVYDIESPKIQSDDINNNGDEETKVFLAITDSEKLPISNNLAYAGAGIMNFANSIPSLRYLAKHYIPVMPYIDAAYDYLGISNYSNEVNSGIYIVGGVLLGCSVGQCFALLPLAAGYYIRPYAYQGRDNILNAIRQADYPEDSYLFKGTKFVTYIGTDVVLSAAISSPLTALDQSITMSSMLWGAGMGAVNYFDEYREVSSFANNTAFVATTIAGVLTISKLETPVNIILNFPAIPAIMAATHHVTRFITDKIYNFLPKEDDLFEDVNNILGRNYSANFDVV